MTDQCIYRTFQQTFTDEAVETTDYYAECETLGVQFSFEKMWHDEPPKVWPDHENRILSLTEQNLCIRQMPI